MTNNNDEIFNHVLRKLEEDFDALDSVSEEAKEEPASNRRLETLAMIANSRTKLARAIFAGLILQGDPRYTKLLQSGEKDLARVVRNYLALNRKERLMAFKSGLPRKRRFEVWKEE